MSTLSETHLVFGLGVAEDGTESFYTGNFDPASGTFALPVDHLSKFKVLGLDIGGAFKQARTAVMQGMGLEFSEPECVGNPAVVDGARYEVVSPAAAYMCVEEEHGSLVVTAHPAIGVPYLLSSVPQGDGATAAVDIGLGTSGMIAVGRALGFFDSGGRTAVFPGAKAVYVFEGAPDSVQFVLEQYPILLLMAILAETLDVIGVTSVKALDALQCLSDVVDTVSPEEEGITGETVGALARAFFSCAGTIGGLTPLGKFVLAALSTAPALLVSAFLGAALQFTDLAVQRVDLSVVRPKELDTRDFLNAELPPNVCWTGTDGWGHESGIQLTDGTGIAVRPDGSFADASVIESSVLGQVDVDGDGKDEVVMALVCSGSHPDTCCAGRASTMLTVATLTVADAGKLQLAAPSLMGGESRPGDEFGPAQRHIAAAEIQGATLVTSEALIYAEDYTADQVGGDPHQPVTVRYRFTNDGWGE